MEKMTEIKMTKSELDSVLKFTNENLIFNNISEKVYNTKEEALEILLNNIKGSNDYPTFIIFKTKDDKVYGWSRYGNYLIEVIDDENEVNNMLELKEGYNGITDPNEVKLTGVTKILESPGYVISVDVFEDIDDVISINGNSSKPVYVLKQYTPTIKVRYHKELCPELMEMEKNPIGDYIDLRAAENVKIGANQFKLISLGISVQLPKGYHAEVVPRSSTYKNFGIIMSNSVGIIDESYCGDNDIWMFPAIALRDTEIKVNDRICQFRLVKNRDINIEVVDKLDNKDRGGIGSTGKN